MPRIPLIEDLTAGPIPPGSQLLVEYDPASLWYDLSLTIAAGWLKTGKKVLYNAAGQSPDIVRSKLLKLGLGERFESEDRVRIIDVYTLTLGEKSPEKYSWPSLNIEELSKELLSEKFLEEEKQRPTRPGTLVILDNYSALARFNDEKSWVSFELELEPPRLKKRKMTGIRGIMNGVHRDWAYKKLEAAYDGIVDFKLEEAGGELKNFMRIRSMRNVNFDSRWHELDIQENFEVTLRTPTQ